MPGISAVGGSLPSAVFQAEYAARAAKLQQDAINQQGDLALKLIASSSAATGTGQQLDIRI